MGRKVRLIDLACARSGDKGGAATLAIIARRPENFDQLQQLLTAERVQAYFAPMGCTAVQRYVLPKIEALSFVLAGVLAGGGSRSLRIDAQGKAIGQVALLMELELPDTPALGPARGGPTS